MTYMKLYHATDSRNLRGIQRLGLLASMSSGRRAAVWAVTASSIDYAVRHCCVRREVPVGRVVVLELTVPTKWVKRYAARGVVYIPRDVAPERIRVYGRLRLERA